MGAQGSYMAKQAQDPTDPAGLGQPGAFQDIFGKGKVGTGGIFKDPSGRPISPQMQNGPADNSKSSSFGDGIDTGGRPQSPSLHNWLDPTQANGLDPNASFDTSTLLPGMLNKNAMQGGYAVDTNSLQGLEKYANSTENSPWLNLTNQKIAGQTAGLQDQGMLDAQANSSGAMNAAASHGGLSGGAAARIAGRGATAGTNAMQQANQWGEQGKLSAGIAEQADKMNTMRSLPGAQLDLARYNSGLGEFNATTENSGKLINNQNFISGVKEGNQNDLTKYGEQMKGYIGDNASNALMKSGKKK